MTKESVSSVKNEENEMDVIDEWNWWRMQSIVRRWIGPLAPKISLALVSFSHTYCLVWSFFYSSCRRDKTSELQNWSIANAIHPWSEGKKRIQNSHYIADYSKENFGWPVHLFIFWSLSLFYSDNVNKQWEQMWFLKCHVPFQELQIFLLKKSLWHTVKMAKFCNV